MPVPRKSRLQLPWGIILQAAVVLGGVLIAWGAVQGEQRAQRRDITELKTTCSTESTAQANLSWIRSLDAAMDRRLSALEAERRGAGR